MASARQKETAERLLAMHKVYKPDEPSLKRGPLMGPADFDVVIAALEMYAKERS